MAIPDPGRHRELPRPVLQAMLVCDQAIPHADADKTTLVGIFNRMEIDQFPQRWSRPTTLYARVTDAEGDYAIRLELVRLEDERTVGRADSRLDIEDRMASHEMIFDLEEVLVFERPGRYEFRLFADGRHVGGTVLTVVQEA